MKVGVIGANGFLGHHLVTVLEERQKDLILFGRAEVTNHHQEYYQLDLQNESDFDNIPPLDFLYYLASDSIPSSTWDYPLLEIENNLLPFLKLINRLCENGLKRMAFISSGGTIYGDTHGKIGEAHVKRPKSPHGITKLSMEYWCYYFFEKFALSTDIYRVSNIYGEGQNTGKGLGIINTWLELIHQGKPVSLYGQGEHIRNFIYVQDVALAIATSLDFDDEGINLFNLSSHQSLSLADLLKDIEQILNRKIQVNFLPQRASDVLSIDLDNRRFLERNPSFQFTPLEEGIVRTYQHMTKNE